MESRSAQPSRGGPRPQRQSSSTTWSGKWSWTIARALPPHRGEAPASSQAVFGSIPSQLASSPAPPPEAIELCCFRKYLGKPQSANSTPLSSPRSTIFYDTDGFPNLDDYEIDFTPPKLKHAPANDITPPLDVPPVVPVTKARKANVKEERAAVKASAKAKAKVVSAPAVKRDMDVIICRPRLSINSGRLELCAQDDMNKRIFVYGTTKKAWGATMEADSEEVKRFIENTAGVTKAAALVVKEELRHKRS